MSDETKDTNAVEDMGEFDMVICGTSVKECFLSGILSSCDGKKCLVLDKNSHYGGEGASFNLNQVYNKFRKKGAQADEKKFGRSGQWSIDIAPKFLIGDGILVQCLVKLIPSEYMDFSKVGGSYVFAYTSAGYFSSRKIGGLHEVPTTPSVALNSPMISSFQKVRFPIFLKYIAAYNPADPETHGGYDLKTMTMAQLYYEYSIDKLGQLFVGHAIALENNESYLNQPAEPTVLKIQLYANSLQRFKTSPYIYPRYGLGNIADSFSRLGAIYGCTFITNCQDLKLNYASDGKFSGVNFTHALENKKYTARAPLVLGHPDYFDAKHSVVTGQICRSIVLLAAPLWITDEKSVDNCQVIIPGQEAKRKSDMYISFLSSSHYVCPQNRYFAVISTMNDGKRVTDINNKKATSQCVVREMRLALAILAKSNKILDRFDWVSNERAPAASLPEGVVMTRSMDASTHFQDVMKEVFQIYTQITGKKFDITQVRSAKDIQREAQEKEEAEEKARAAAEAAAAPTE